VIPADGYGYVQIDGDLWRAVSADKAEITVGTIVKVIERNSIILTVTSL
jgi:membrane protein implicated in regulation of membrane protease activity